MLALAAVLALASAENAQAGPAEPDTSVTVTVSSYASGNFGSGYDTQSLEQPMVKGLTVSGSGVITIASTGTWCLHDGEYCSGGNGSPVSDPTGPCTTPSNKPLGWNSQPQQTQER